VVIGHIKKLQMNQIYQNTKSFRFSFALLFTALFCTGVSAQTLTTVGATNYGGLSIFPAGNTGAITFVVQNSNATARILTKVDCFAAADQPDNTYSLWFSSTSLSGTPNITAPAWTLAATGTPVSAAADGIITVLDNLSVVIPPNTQYRFALTTTNGIRYTGTTGGTPSPNNFSAGGLTMRLGNSQISGFNVGYGGGAPSPANTPRYFTGSLFFTTCSSTTPASVPTVTPDTLVCGEGSSVSLRVISGDLNGAGSWKWYSGSCGGTLVGTGTSVTVNPAASTTYYARGEGGCATAAGSCGSVAVTIRTKPGNPTVPAVAPICQGSLAHLVINPVTLGTTPIPDSVTVTSAALSIAVPDNIGTGASTSLTIPALPFGSQMTGVDVTLNMLHTYPGDMIFHLQAPNGTIANLYKYGGGEFTGNSGNMPNAGWFNAVTSSAGTIAYSSIDSPYRYNAGRLFAPDLLNSNVGVPVENPDNFISNAVNISELYSTPSGSWTLAMADGGPGDLGTLTSWAIKIKYNRFQQIPAQPAVWTPGATLFVDAAGTIAYDGTTPRMDVYAKPNATTTYTATSVLNGCYSDPTTTDVTVHIPAGVAVSPVNKTICAQGTAPFEVTASGTTPTYQWQTDKGTGTFENITDNANYAGATTDSLTVKNAPASWNGYKYHCVVSTTSACANTATSADAVLTVNPTPVVTLTADKTALLPGNISMLSVASTPSAAAYSWMRNELPFDGSTTGTFNATIDDQGIYKVTVTDINGCVGTSNALEISDSVVLKMFIYPNPSEDGKFSVSYYSLKGNVLPRVLTIYDSKGALIIKRTYNINTPYQRMEVDFSGLSKGIYFVNLLDRSFKRIATGKVVVK
jgi:subtilisin-like proprotein convertase family protein